MKKLIFISSMAMLCCLFACNTYQKQLQKAQTLFIQHPDELAKLSVKLFPGTKDTLVLAKDSTVTTTVRIDSSFVLPVAKMDSLFGAGHVEIIRDTVIKNVNRYITTQIFKTDTLKIPDQRLIDLAKHSADSLSKSLTQTKLSLADADNENDVRRDWIVGLSAFALLLVAVIVIRFFF